MPDPHNRSFAVLHGPHSPSNSDSPLSLVVRKDEDPRFRTDAVHRKAHGDSPGLFAMNTIQYSQAAEGANVAVVPR